MVSNLGTSNQRGATRIQIRMWVVSFLLFAFGSLDLIAAPTFSTSLDRSTIALGESVTLSLSFENGSPSGQPNLPPIANIQVAGTGSQRSMSMVNGHVTQTTTFTYQLTPTKEGDYTIPGFKAQIDGQQVASQPLTLKVVKASALNAPGGEELAYIKLIVPKNEMYLGEVMPVEIQCYFQNPATDFGLPQIGGEGFLVGKIPQEQQRQNPRQVGRYLVFRFTVTVSATRTGPLTLGPVTWGLVSLSGPTDFWGNYRHARQLSVASDPVSIQALPLPTANAPESFSGTIGSFSLQSYTAGPTNVAVGDPITLKIQIAGNGSFDTLTLPNTQPNWNEFKTYPPTSKFDPSDSLQTQGSKSFEQVITPQNSDVKEIPEFQFSYFDPNQKQFCTLKHPAIPLVVRPTAATPQPTIISSATPQQEEQAPAQEIVHIKVQLGTVRGFEKPWIRQPGFVMLQAIAPLVWIGSVVWRRRKENLDRNPRLRRQREVARIVEEGLNDLEKHAAANQSQEFFATLFRVLQEQLGERVEQPASAVTEAVLDQLGPQALDSNTMTLLRELFQACNQNRYAPAHKGHELQALVPKARAAIQEVQKMSVRRVAIDKGVVMRGIAVLLFLSALHSQAADPGDAFNKANSLYEQKKYSEAAAAYEQIVQGGAVSPALYFNLGNAWFKAGQIGKSIAAFRRAELLAPRDPDVVANLQFARNQVGGTPAIPGSKWTKWINRLSLNEWTLMAVIAVSLFFLNLAARQISPRWKKTSNWAVLLTTIGSAISISCLWVAADRQLNTSYAVVTSSEAVVRRGPFEESQSAFSLRDGAECIVLDTKEGWLQVADSRKHSGWVQQKHVIVLSGQTGKL